MTDNVSGSGGFRGGLVTSSQDVDPQARFILELAYDGRRLENVNVIRRGEVTP